MKTDPATDLMTARLTQAIRDYTPRHSTKFRKLLPMKDSIAELRGKGASYAAIADILRNINVPVANDTVFRFCHEVLGEPMTRRRKRRKIPVRIPVEEAHEKSRRNHAASSDKSNDNQPVRSSQHSDEPRIADPNTI